MCERNPLCVSTKLEQTMFHHWLKPRAIFCFMLSIWRFSKKMLITSSCVFYVHNILVQRLVCIYEWLLLKQVGWFSPSKSLLNIMLLLNQFQLSPKSRVYNYYMNCPKIWFSFYPAVKYFFLFLHVLLQIFFESTITLFYILL